MRRLNDGGGYNRAMNAPIPARTETYSPIGHAFFLDTISGEIRANGGLEVTGTNVFTNGKGTQMVGYTGVKHSRLETDPDFGLEMMIGYKNSYDKSMSAGLAAGINVMVCGNGVVTGDMLSFIRKHTGTIQEELVEKTRQAIVIMKDGFSNLVLEIDIMKDYNLTAKQKAELMGVMYFEEGMVTPNQLSIVKKEMTDSEHFGGNTLWDLYNNVTESFKSSHPIRHIEDHVKLHTFMKGVAGITADIETADEGFGIETEENVGITTEAPSSVLQVGNVDPIDGRN
jgi:hypothetical protein